MRKTRRGYVYNIGFGSRRDILNSMKRMRKIFKFPNKRKHKLSRYFVYCSNKSNFYPNISPIPIGMYLDLARDSDEEEDNN